MSITPAVSAACTHVFGGQPRINHEANPVSVRPVGVCPPLIAVGGDKRCQLSTGGGGEGGWQQEGLPGLLPGAREAGAGELLTCWAVGQAALLEAGRAHEIVQETRLFDEAQQTTYSMRKKEGLADYRYFPEPDLGPVVITDEYVSAVEVSRYSVLSLRSRWVGTPCSVAGARPMHLSQPVVCWESASQDHVVG